MLPDFPGTSQPPAPVPEGERDPLLLRLRGFWWAVPVLLLGLDIFFTVSNFATRSFGYLGELGPLRMLLLWTPFAMGVTVILGTAAFLWTRRTWSGPVQAGVLAGAAMPLLRFAFGRFGPMSGFSGFATFIQFLAGPVLGLALAGYAMTLRRGLDPAARRDGAAGTFALAIMASVAGGWIAWALLPLLGLICGDSFASEAADPRAPEGEPSSTSLRVAGLGGLACALAALVVPIMDLVQGRGASAPLFFLDALALVAGSLGWTLLGAHWANGRSEGKILRIFTWLVLGLPVLFVLLLIALLLIFKPRLF